MRREPKVEFNVVAIEAVVVNGPADFAARDLMSPYVWRERDGSYAMLVRAVPKPGETGDTGSIWLARGADGVSFAVTEPPVIAPGPGPLDIGGCEDPTVVVCEDGGFLVYYTGVDAAHAHGEMLYASGPALDRLEKRGVAFASTPSQGNVKEATIDRTREGKWRLFYEYAHADASLIGLALGDDVAGPWHHMRQPFAPRPGSWDGWHLSTGPMLTDDKAMPVMFYNGATRDARWRIGWVAFDAEYRAVVDRCIEPLIVPPPQDDRAATDIAFAASVVVVDGAIWLYFSREDALLYRAEIRKTV